MLVIVFFLEFFFSIHETSPLEKINQKNKSESFLQIILITDMEVEKSDMTKENYYVNVHKHCV